MSFIDRLKRLSSGPEKDENGVSSPRHSIWSSTFDPGSNANVGRKVGASYYDKPSQENPSSIWEQHLQSAAARAPSDAATATPGAGSAMDAASIKRMFSPDKVDAALKKADPSGAGKVDMDTFMSMLRNT